MVEPDDNQSQPAQESSFELVPEDEAPNGGFQVDFAGITKLIEQAVEREKEIYQRDVEKLKDEHAVEIAQLRGELSTANSHARNLKSAYDNVLCERDSAQILEVTLLEILEDPFKALIEMEMSLTDKNFAPSYIRPYLEAGDRESVENLIGMAKKCQVLAEKFKDDPKYMEKLTKQIRDSIGIAKVQEPQQAPIAQPQQPQRNLKSLAGINVLEAQLDFYQNGEIIPEDASLLPNETYESLVIRAPINVKKLGLFADRHVVAKLSIDYGTGVFCEEHDAKAYTTPTGIKVVIPQYKLPVDKLQNMGIDLTKTVTVNLEDVMIEK